MSATARTMRVLIPAALFLASCGDAMGPEPEPITELPRALTASEQAVISDANAFGLSLLAQVAARDERPNIVLSPLSASMALGMTLNGADGTTFDAMRSTLGFGTLAREDINDAYRGLIDLLTTLDPAVRFDIANAIWANEDVTFHDAFFQAVRAAFDARVEAADFSDPGTLDEINGWVADNTQGYIDRILDQLDPDLVMLLANAIYFDGAWTTQFDPADTRSAEFHREDGSTVQVEMMHMEDATIAMGGGSDYAVAELPYGGEAFSMVILAPNGTRSARELLADLDPGEWGRAIGSLAERKLDVLSVPKFRLSYDSYLNDALKAMGMDVAFRPGADFSRMSPAGKGMCIDFVRQKTFIEVDERGTKAAAVTAVGIRPTSFNGFVVDRPFVFAIRERLSGTILFVGLVEDPTETDSGEASYTSTCG